MLPGSVKCGQFIDLKAKNVDVMRRRRVRRGVCMRIMRDARDGRD